MGPNKEVQRTHIKFEHGELGESYEGKLERDRTIDDAANRTAPLKIRDSYDRPNTSQHVGHRVKQVSSSPAKALNSFDNT